MKIKKGSKSQPFLTKSLLNSHNTTTNGTAFKPPSLQIEILERKVINWLN